MLPNDLKKNLLPNLIALGVFVGAPIGLLLCAMVSGASSMSRPIEEQSGLSGAAARARLADAGLWPDGVSPSAVSDVSFHFHESRDSSATLVRLCCSERDASTWNVMLDTQWKEKLEQLGTLDSYDLVTRNGTQAKVNDIGLHPTPHWWPSYEHPATCRDLSDPDVLGFSREACRWASDHNYACGWATYSTYIPSTRTLLICKRRRQHWELLPREKPLQLGTRTKTGERQ